MQFSQYEELYTCVNYVSNTGAMLIDKIAEYMQQHSDTPMTCKEITRGIYGETFDNEKWMQKSYISTVSHALSLLSNHYIKREKIPDGEPIEVEIEKKVRVDKNNRPIMIKVTAADGRSFEIPDPEALNWSGYAKITEKKIVQPKKIVFTWIN